jgi:hypothetical protein
MYVFVDRCLSLCPFLAIVLSVLLRFTDSDYSFDIFKLFFLFSPTMTHGSGIWISEFKPSLQHILPYQKVQNMIIKYITCIYGKVLNLAIYTEIGLYPICFKSYKLMFQNNTLTQSMTEILFNSHSTCTYFRCLLQYLRNFQNISIKTKLLYKSEHNKSNSTKHLWFYNKMRSSFDMKIIVGVSEWLLLNAIPAVFQPYHGENKLIFNECWWGPLCTRPTHE